MAEAGAYCRDLAVGAQMRGYGSRHVARASGRGMAREDALPLLAALVVRWERGGRFPDHARAARASRRGAVERGVGLRDSRARAAGSA
jgi:hypothetical protein